MAFQGGPVPLVAVNPSFVNFTSSPLTSTYDPQVYKGVGQSFIGTPGQALTGRLASSAINIGLNSLLGNQVTSFSGIPLTAGSNISATALAPFVSNILASGINQTVQSTLASAGAFGPALSQGLSAGLSLVTGGLGGVLGTSAGLVAGTVWGLLAFPGGGNEPRSQYNDGIPYTLTTGGSDVRFSIQPANQGPQLFGQDVGINDPKAPTKMAFTQFAGTVPNYAGLSNDALNYEKLSDIGLTSFGTATDYEEYWKPESAIQFQNAAFGVDTYNNILDAATGGWTFITAPEEISWTTSNEVSRVDMFGTNGPPVVSGTRGMRDLTLGNALVEGFIRNVNVEAKVLALENLLNYSLNTEAGFVDVPVYQIWANNKMYGGNGYYVIKEVRVKETMRDLRGKSTRAYVDVSFMEVPEYQVSDGRDQASYASAAAGGPQRVALQANQKISKTNWSGVAAANPQFAKPSFSAGSSASLSAFTSGNFLK